MPNISWKGLTPTRGLGGRFSTTPGPGRIAIEFRPTGTTYKAKLFKKRPETLVNELTRMTLKHALEVKDYVAEYPGGVYEGRGGTNYKALAGRYLARYRPAGGKWRDVEITHPKFESRYRTFGYERTGTLFANWIIHPRMTAAGYIVTIKNNAVDKYGRSYAPYVHGPAGVQRSYHIATGWRSLYDPKILKQAEFKRAVQDQIDAWAYGV